MLLDDHNIDAEVVLDEKTIEIISRAHLYEEHVRIPEYVDLVLNDYVDFIIIVDMDNEGLPPVDGGPVTYKGATSLALTFRSITSGYNETLLPKQTAIAQISLASHPTPLERINHSIKVRARTLTGSQGVIKAALYEGATNRSGDLVSGILRNLLDTYVLEISDVAAATITNYSNLSIKFWGYDVNGAGLIFEVSEIYLELPEAFKQTEVAEISLASHSTPPTRINHSIKVRARTISGSTGVLKAALYEGTTKRSVDLQTPLLTNSLTDYTLAISEADAATITSYANLSVRFWGYDSAGNALVFEVSRLYLELPLSGGSVTRYGAISCPINFGASVGGNINAKQTAVAEISLSSHGVPSVRTNHSLKLRARTISGSTGVLKAALYEGVTKRSADLETPLLTNFLTDYTLPISEASAASITTYVNLSIKFWGYDSAGNALVFEVAKFYLELPVSSGPTTHYGVISRSTTFGAVVAGNKTSKQTSVAEISLASHATPSTRTNHSFKIRARTTSGSTGVIKVALYEGSTNRSGDLSTSALNNSLTDYTVAISDAAAAAITSYSNLSIKIWGYDSAGNALVFEVARLYLELPAI